MAETTVPEQKQPNAKRGKRSKWPLAVLLLVIGSGLAGGYWWVFVRNKVTTDDAYVMADSAVISSRIPASISAIGVENDDLVKTGEVLVELDPRDYQAVVDKQRAALSRIEAEIDASEVTIRLTETQTGSQVKAAEATTQITQKKQQEAIHRLEELRRNRVAAEAELRNTKRDSKRYENLFRQGGGSEQQKDETNTAFKKAQAQLEAIDAQIAAAQASFEAITREIDRANAQLDTTSSDKLRVDIEKHKLAALKAEREEIRAELRTAELNLSYCTIRAPISGYIAQKKIQVGERVQVGQPLLAIIPLHDVYAEANFKETQLRDVRLGQPVEIKADIYPGHTYHGRVEGIRAGTGAAFSLLPTENATGNWIKIVQRVPVKIRLDSPPPREYPLRVGLSLEVTVSTKDKSGLRLVQETRPDRQIQSKME